MSRELEGRIFGELDALVLIDPHTHINPHAPAATNLVDLLGYHYYTELAHSAGVPRLEIEAPGLSPKEKVSRIVAGLGPLENTVQYSWLIELAQEFFDFQHERLTKDNWEGLYDAVETKGRSKDWPAEVLKQSRLEAVFLTNDFDDPLAGFDPKVYVPCLRTDDLVFHFSKGAVRERLSKSTGIEATNASQLVQAIGKLFERFKARGARACAISLPPDFSPEKISRGEADAAIAAACSGKELTSAERRTLSNFAFWSLAEHCDAHGLPFDLMIGVNRAVYAEGVYQGQDLFDSRVSLIQYKELFNAFPRVMFPISVLASSVNQELTSYAWIFPNVIAHGHWWYSNTPTFIEHDLAARLEAAPANKQIGYYSDMYKLEFAAPKFRMFRRVLSRQLAQKFCIDRGWSEERAIAFGTQVLSGNVERVFFGEFVGRCIEPTVTR